MSGEDKLNTAEHDAKGRCVRHPDIRLRKKKLLGGWKILIGHCPECCLEEMRRVRDEIEGGESKRKKEKKKDKKKKTKPRGGDDREKDGMSLTSDGYDPNVGDHHGGGGNGGRYPGSGGRRHHHREDGESEATGSTAQMSGGGSVVSEQYYREGAHMSSGVVHGVHHGGDFGRGGYHQPSYQSQMIGHQPPPERTMVLSMAFIDPHTGHRGTYTGQVNSLTHKPDGKGTVYYNNGMIAEGSWSNGVLTGDGSSNGGSDEGHDDQGDYPYSPADRSSSRPKTNDSRSQSRNRAADQDLGISGNLHLLSGLPGAQSRPRGASASVQSYNSRTSHGQISGSASVTAAYVDQGSTFYGGSGSHYRPPQRGHHQHSQGFHGRMHGPPTMNKRGEYEP